MWLIPSLWASAGRVDTEFWREGGGSWQVGHFLSFTVCLSVVSSTVSREPGLKSQYNTEFGMMNLCNHFKLHCHSKTELSFHIAAVHRGKKLHHMPFTLVQIHWELNKYRQSQKSTFNPKGHSEQFPKTSESWVGLLDSIKQCKQCSRDLHVCQWDYA